MNIAAAGLLSPLPFYNLAFKTYQEKTGNTVTYGVLVVVVESEA